MFAKLACLFSESALLCELSAAVPAPWTLSGLARVAAQEKAPQRRVPAAGRVAAAPADGDACERSPPGAAAPETQEDAQRRRRALAKWLRQADALRERQAAGEVRGGCCAML